MRTLFAGFLIYLTSWGEILFPCHVSCSCVLSLPDNSNSPLWGSFYGYKFVFMEPSWRGVIFLSDGLAFVIFPSSGLHWSILFECYNTIVTKLFFPKLTFNVNSFFPQIICYMSWNPRFPESRVVERGYGHDFFSWRAILGNRTSYVATQFHVNLRLQQSRVSVPKLSLNLLRSTMAVINCFVPPLSR